MYYIQLYKVSFTCESGVFTCILHSVELTVARQNIKNDIMQICMHFAEMQ